jgi:hypothetical protein
VLVVGGIPHKAPKIIQLLADVKDIPIRVSETVQAAARGVAVGVGAAPSFAAAQARHCEGIQRAYAPDPARGPFWTGPIGPRARLWRRGRGIFPLNALFSGEAHLPFM